MLKTEQTTRSGFATASLILGIIGVCTSFIPFINNLSFILGILAIIFAIIALIKKASKGKAIAGLILAILAIIITLSAQQATGEALNEVGKEFDKATGASTEEVLQNDVDIELGKFNVTTDEYGITETKMTVKVTNKTSETKSFNIQVEAIDSNGNRINQDYIYANNLTAGQSQDFDIFEFVASEDIEKMQNATFNIVEASIF